MVDRFFNLLSRQYRFLLGKIIQVPWLVMLAVLLVSAGTVMLMERLPAEYAPSEDRGAFFISLRAPEGATLEYTDRSTSEMERLLMTRTGEDQPIRRFLTRLPGGWGSSSMNSSTIIVLLRALGYTH